jgi:hypothetical protein
LGIHLLVNREGFLDHRQFLDLVVAGHSVHLAFVEGIVVQLSANVESTGKGVALLLVRI